MAEKLAANIRAENILSQVDYGGNHYQVLTEVNDNNKVDSAIANVDCFIKSISGNLNWKRKSRGWELLVEWKEGSVDWVPLKYLKQSNPVELAEYAVIN